MDQFSHVLLAIQTIDKVHSTQEGAGLWTRLRWVKPGLWAQLSHPFYIEYLWQVREHLY